VDTSKQSVRRGEDAVPLDDRRKATDHPRNVRVWRIRGTHSTAVRAERKSTFHWRQLYREGRLGNRATAKLLPVTVDDERLVDAEKVAEPVSLSRWGPSRSASLEERSKSRAG